MSGTPQHSIIDVWNENLEKFPNKTAFICREKEYTFAEIDRMSSCLSGHLQRRFGVKKGDRIATALPNCIEYVIAYWAIMKLGAVVVPVNTRLSPDDIAYVLTSTEGEVVFAHADVWEPVQEAFGEAPGIKTVIAIGFSGEDTVAFDELIGEGEPADATEITEGDMAIIMHTSGTTGRPKGAIMKHGNLLFNLKNAIMTHSFRHEDVHLLVVPMFHATALYSMLPSNAYQGSTVVIAPKPDVKELVELIQKHRITTFIGVPTLFYFLTTMKNVDKFDLGSLRLIAYAGSPMPPQTIVRLREKLPNVALHNFFGLTETISMTHVLPSRDALERADSIGKVLPQVRQLIVDDDGKPVPPGTIGELCFAKENVIDDYWKRPGLLDESIIDGKWFRTGDYAMVDEQGYVYLKGRKKEMIIVGGENVYVNEVENVVLSHPDVLEVAVVGVEAKGVRSYLGEVVKAVVVLQPGAEATELDIKRHCKDKLASYEMPQIVQFMDELPRNPTGKVLKQKLK
ncbi:MAG: long-chain fatty acid--CoA ligase [Planctomycetes bacterium]|nr:long-chain fatty acid--CoA ligase [Planctomycetota bacterium]